MESISKIVDTVIDLAIEHMYSEIEDYNEEDGHHFDINLSPEPELYEKLTEYFTKVLKDKK